MESAKFVISEYDDGCIIEFENRMYIYKDEVLSELLHRDGKVIMTELMKLPDMDWVEEHILHLHGYTEL